MWHDFITQCPEATNNLSNVNSIFVMNHTKLITSLLVFFGLKLMLCRQGLEGAIHDMEGVCHV